MDLNNITRDLKKHSITYVLQKYDLTWQELIRIQTEKHVINNEHDQKYITINQNNQKYMIIKDTIYYGSYDTLHEARTIQEELILCNWNKNSIPILLRKHNIHSNTEYLK